VTIKLKNHLKLSDSSS